MTVNDFQTTDGFFTIAPFDHRGSLAESLRLDLSRIEDANVFLMLKHLFMKTLSPYVSTGLTFSTPMLMMETPGETTVSAGGACTRRWSPPNSTTSRRWPSRSRMCWGWHDPSRMVGEVAQTPPRRRPVL
jgi:hypothetical protein